MKFTLTILSFLILISCDQQTSETKAITYQKREEAKTEKESQKKSVTCQKTYNLNDFQITLIQTKGDGSEFYCKSKLLISKDNSVFDSLTFTPEPLGGHYGISKPDKIENHLVFTKHGDYDGRTIIINRSGEVFNVIGGKNFYDPKKGLMFTIYKSDLNGFAVFDLKTDSLTFEMQEIEDEPLSFHRDFDDRYFISCFNVDGDSTESEFAIWEIEFELGRIMQVDLDTNQINQSNILNTWTKEEVNCECEK